MVFRPNGSPVWFLDSPDMLDMWEQVTSPGAVLREGVRAQMASLAQQIIDALPERIKQEGLPEKRTAKLLVRIPAEQKERSGEAKEPMEQKVSDFINFR